jgi:hypothetical protein
MVLSLITGVCLVFTSIVAPKRDLRMRWRSDITSLGVDEVCTTVECGGIAGSLFGLAETARRLVHSIRRVEHIALKPLTQFSISEG